MSWTRRISVSRMDWLYRTVEYACITKSLCSSAHKLWRCEATVYSMSGKSPSSRSCGCSENVLAISRPNIHLVKPYLLRFFIFSVLHRVVNVT